MRQPHQTCETCAYCAKVDTTLECRFRPPVVLMVSDYPRSLWPEVDAKDWCGEWSPRA